MAKFKRKQMPQKKQKPPKFSQKQNPHSTTTTATMPTRTMNPTASKEADDDLLVRDAAIVDPDRTVNDRSRSRGGTGLSKSSSSDPPPSNDHRRDDDNNSEDDDDDSDVAPDMDSYEEEEGPEQGDSTSEGEESDRRPSDGESTSGEENNSDDDEDDDDNDNEGEGDGDSEEDDDDDSADHEDRVPSATNQISSSSAFGEPCTFDLRNLLALNSHQVDTQKLYSTKEVAATTSSFKSITIPGPPHLDAINEQYLLKSATDGCQQLLEALWQLPVERSDAGPLVALPSHEEVRIPRALPLPPPKRETKWEKFAKERGIALNDAKRSQKVWDEDTKTWMYRHGYRKANDGNQKDWPIMEVKDGQDPFEDPWERQRDAKRAKVDKNLENQLRNQERGGAVPKGTANKVLKNRAKAREEGKEGGRIDRMAVPPSGVPVDLRRTKGTDDSTQSRQRGKASTLNALAATQRSTASLGKFDKMREGEPERKKALAGLKKRKLESATDKKVVSTEAERSLKVLKAVVDGGGVAKERAIKKGKLAKGETAYDYDFDDGLGASSFRKKKGRAGAGKVKKMTKKRIK